MSTRVWKLNQAIVKGNINIVDPSNELDRIPLACKGLAMLDKSNTTKV